jgi:hypothetical protein
MTLKEWERQERKIVNGGVAYFYDDVRREFLYAYRQGRKFLLQTEEDNYTLKASFNLREIGQYLTAKRRY